MKWFRHLTRAHEDRAVEKLIHEFGIKGYGLYFYCLEIIAGGVEASNITFELEPDAEILARRLSMDTLEVERIMHRCIELRLFEIADNGRITCLKMATFLDTASTSNPEIRKIIKNSTSNSQDSSRFVKIHQEVSEQIRLDEIRLEENNHGVAKLQKAYSELHKQVGYPDKIAFGDTGKTFKRLLETHSLEYLLDYLTACFRDEWCKGKDCRFSLHKMTTKPMLDRMAKEVESIQHERQDIERRNLADQERIAAEKAMEAEALSPEERDRFFDSLKDIP